MKKKSKKKSISNQVKKPTKKIMALTVTGLLVFAFSITVFVPSKSEASSESKKHSKLKMSDLPESPEGYIRRLKTYSPDMPADTIIVSPIETIQANSEDTSEDAFIFYYYK